MNACINQLLDFLKASVSPFHTVNHSILQLEAAVFTQLDYKKPWALTPGGAYYCRTFSGELFAFKLGSALDLSKGIRIAAGHIDWPCLKIKPAPTFSKQGYIQANVEVYGGPILNTFLDRPLSLAGKIAVAGNDLLHPEVIYIDLKKPICIIPNLAIHMNRKVNEGVELDRQQHMMPLIGMINEQLNENDALLDYVARAAGVSYDRILDYELYLYNLDEPAFVGINEEFLSSPRLDDTTAVSAIIHGLIESTPKDTVSLCALFDNEEVGSQTKQGADATMLTRIIERIWEAFGRTPADCARDIHGGMILSIDVGHAWHPNYPGVSDITNMPVLGKGFQIKTDSNQKYAWDCEAAGALIGLCRHYGIPYQRFVKRSNIAGGGTIASLISSQLPLKTVDMGVGLLSMHSSRELMGTKDQASLQDAVKYFMSE